MNKTSLICDHYSDGGWRIENKYYISLEEAAALRSRLRAIMKKDPHSDSNWGYKISSVYYDDHDDKALCDSNSGIRIRKKYRIRIYNRSDSVISVECKLKNGALSQKTSFRISRADYDCLMSGDPTVLQKYQHPLAADFYYDIAVNGFHPATIVEYDREVYVYPICDVRITFDRNIKGTVSGLDLFKPHILAPVVPSHAVLLEVKYNHALPDFIRSVLPCDIMQKVANCKYKLCREYI